MFESDGGVPPGGVPPNEEHTKDGGGFAMIKNLLAKLPMTKNLAVVFDFFESCGISMKQLQNLASGNASSADLDKTITPIVYKTVPALQGALEYLESEHGDGEAGGSFLMIRNTKTKGGDVQPYVFICTKDEDGRPVPVDYFPYFKSASFILQAMENNKKRLENHVPAQLPEHADASGE